MTDKPVRFHTHSDWWFTRMPNGDVVVSAGDGVQGVTLNANTWASVVREMGSADTSESDEYPDATHRTLPYAVWTKFPDESVEVIQMSGRNAVVAVRRIKSDTSEASEHEGS